MGHGLFAKVLPVSTSTLASLSVPLNDRKCLQMSDNYHHFSIFFWLHVYPSSFVIGPSLLEEDGPVPAAGTFSYKENDHFGRIFGSYEGPFIVKPTSGRASQHVETVDRLEDLDHTFFEPDQEDKQNLT